MKPLIKLISRVFLALALCVSAPVAFAGDSSYDIDKERIAQEVREKAMSGDLDGAAAAVETYEDSFLAEVKLWIATGGDVNAKDENGVTPLHWAAVASAPGRVAQLLLENGAKIVADGYGYTPLHFAMPARNAPSFAKVLIDYGADVNAKSNRGYTPLHLAVKYGVGYGDSYGETELVQLLIDNGADVNANEAPLLYEAILENMLYYRGADVIVGENVIKLLIDNGADVNARHEKLPEVESAFCDSCTPLHVAIFIPRPESMENVMKLLIDNGADVNALITGDWNNGYTPLDMAVEEYLAWVSRGSVGPGVGPEAAKLLIEHGGYCNVVTGYLCGEPVAPPEPKADYTGLYANAAFAVAGAFAPSWVDTQTFAFNEGDKLVTGQSLSVPLDDFTFAAKRVQVNDLTDYEFAVKWEMEF